MPPTYGPTPEPPRRRHVDGVPCLIVNGVRLWSAPPPHESYGDDRDNPPPASIGVRPR